MGMRPETKARDLAFYGKQLKHLQEKASKDPHNKKIRREIRRHMDKIDKIKSS
ncbi:MAG: hypothetical protein Q8M92_10140 [Candidatus Subteraquimicrobiales bacterium]|nr:hypothetical protein [Candidatus Subteraquimicrobiales bacterium]